MLYLNHPSMGMRPRRAPASPGPRAGRRRRRPRPPRASAVSALRGRRTRRRYRSPRGRCWRRVAHIVDPRFRESLILITDHARNGSAGLIVNHPTHVAVTHALTGLIELRDLDEDHLYVGGPIASDEVFILMRSDSPRPVIHVFANIYFGRCVEALRQLAPHVNPHETLRMYIGYVGWTAGQLEEEIERGDWIVAPPDGETIFNASPQILWQRFIKNWSGQWL